jgi:molybdenum cofactor biosynthesis enzyme MoaA
MNLIPQMFKIGVVEIELSSLCNAKCSACMRTILDERDEWYYKGNVSLDDIIDWFESLDISDTKIKMCGVLGDPMINPELYEIIFYFLYEKNVRDIEMSTNGGTRPIQFWKDLGLLSKQSNKRFHIHWAVDGVTRNDYRENVILDKVWENINAYHSTGGHSIWQYIIFDYNESEVEMARTKAKENGMKFATRVSWRNTSEKAKVTSKAANKIDSDSYEVVEKRARSKQYEDARIVCRHKVKGEIYIGANKRLWPCCHLYDESISHKSNDINHLYGKIGHDFNDLTKYSISNILESNWFKTELEASWNKLHSLHLPRCYLTCGDNGKRAVIKNVEP